ncbi:MAG: MliC family protein [Aeromonas sp.]|uniref:MliC family protein n=1 Tax=Aeromonas sp. TaxID=647 RepID=UPI003D6AB675
MKLSYGSLLLALPFTALAAPSFDCTKASGAVEPLICEDAALAKLDNQLNHLWPKAIKEMSEEDRKNEKASQRGWIKGRNDCWKADDVRACVEQSYLTRITELQIMGGQVMVPSPVGYRCGDSQVVVYFYDETALPSAVINLDERGKDTQQFFAFQTKTASGAKYETTDLSLWVKGREARLTRFGQPDSQCRGFKASAE